MKEALGLSANSVEKYARMVREGTEPITDWAVYDKLLRLGSRIIDTEMMDHRLELADAQFVQLEGIQNTYRKEGAAGDVATTAQLTAAEINSLGLVGEKHAESRGRITNLIFQTIERDQAAKKRKLSYQEKRDIIQSITAEAAYTDRWWFFDYGTKRAAYQVEDVDDVPADHEAAIRAEYKKRGVTPSDEMIVRKFVQQAISIGKVTVEKRRR